MMFAVSVSGAGFASEPVAVSMPVTEVAPPIMVRDLAAPVAGVAAPVKIQPTAPEIKPSSKPRLAKKSSIKRPMSMLSRTERKQMALLAVRAQPGSALALDFSGDDDAGSGPDNLDLHRSFSRPKVVKVADQDDEDDILVSEHVKVRLFMARMKAVEAHKMAKAANEDLDDGAGISDAIKVRLALARMKAVAAHQKKFG